jgi:iron complex outermembrane recepter protein
LSASYDINDNLSIIFEGINVTGETRRSYSIYKNRLITLEDTGSRYTLGIRGKF